MSFESKFRNIVGRSENLSKEELTILLRTLLNELNQEKNIKERPRYIDNDSDDDWKEVNEQIAHSKIKRYNWKNILGETLAKRILRLRNKELEADETVEVISRCPGVIDFLERYPRERFNLLKNLKINVHARYGENKTSEQLKWYYQEKKYVKNVEE